MSLREAAQQALEALKMIDNAMPFPVAKHAIKQLSDALAEPEREPYGYFKYDMRLDAWVLSRTNRGVAFYTHPVDDIALLRQALYALENSAVKHPQQIDSRNAAIAALRERLGEKT